MMKKIIDLALRAESHKARENLLYQIIGEFGDSLSKDIQDKLRQKALNERQLIDKINIKIKNL